MLDDDGLGWQSETNSGKQRWSAIHPVVKTSKSILIGINPVYFFIVPRQAFASDTQFDALFAKATG
jgi:hypothetical protein